jgi:CelD/BcsL family acetyltransferase involved in cellulose biosynthesis
MLAAARRRAGHLAPAAFVQTAGRDLAMFADAAFDLVFAIDAMPYVVAGGPALVDATFAEMRRVARPGGDVLVVNHSYRGDLDADRADVRALAARHGLEVVEAGTQPFAHWDGAVFHLRRPPEHGPAGGGLTDARSAVPGRPVPAERFAPAPAVSAPAASAPPRPAAALRTETVTTPDALAALAPEWDALHARCPDATPFQSPAWLLPWWRHLGGGRLHTLAVREPDAGRLVGLVPAFVYDDAADGRATPTLALLGAGVADYGDALFDPAHRDGARAAAVRALCEADVWRAAALDELRDASPLLGAAWPAGVRPAAARQSVVPQRSLPPSWDAFAATLGGTFRRKLNMGANRLRRAPDAGFAAADAAALPALLDALFALHEARWQSRGEAGVLADPRLRPFHGEAAAGFLARGWLRLRVLRIDGRPAAVLYGLHHAGRAYCYLSGIAPDLEYYSPGVAIVRAAVEGAIAEGCTALDLLRGGERYKYLWGVQDAQSWRLTLARGVPSA